jgi:hypothetical protein
MRSILAALLLALLTATNGAAQTQPTPDQSAAIHRARIKIWTGIALMAVGAIALPITAVQSRRDRHDNQGPVLASLGAMAAGGGLVYWGFQQQRRAMSPSTSAGFLVGRTYGVVIRRLW